MSNVKQGTVDAVVPGGASGWIERRANALVALSLSAKGYLFGSLFLAIFVASGQLGVAPDTARPWLWLAGIAFAGTLSRELYLVIAPRAERPWFRWLLASPLVVMVSAYGWGSAADMVNSATGQDPELFPRATAFMAPIAALPAVALLAVLVLTPALLIVLIAWMAQLTSKDQAKTSRAWIWLGRFAGAFSLIAFVSPLIESDSTFHATAEKWAGWMAQGLDMHSDRSCSLGEWDRVRRINDTLIVLVRRTEQGLVFRRVHCALDVD